MAAPVKGSVIPPGIGDCKPCVTSSPVKGFVAGAAPISIALAIGSAVSAAVNAKFLPASEAAVDASPKAAVVLAMSGFNASPAAPKAFPNPNPVIPDNDPFLITPVARVVA